MKRQRQINYKYRAGAFLLTAELGGGWIVGLLSANRPPILLLPCSRST